MPIFLTMFFCATSVLAGSVTFTFNLATNSTTSAGVYRSDGTLVRTLWNNEARPAGTNQGVWDGLDDNAQPMPAQTYQVKIITHNVSYTWEGYIGNTSTAQTGNTVIHYYDHIQDMAITASDIYTVQGYNEGSPLWSRYAISNTNAVASWGIPDYLRVFLYAATDGTRVYFTAQASNYTTPPANAFPSFVTAITASTGAPYNFSPPDGVTTPTSGTQWNGTDYQEGQINFPTGIAVQKNGPYLFVAHGGQNQIKVFNKTTGAAIGSATAAVTAPGRIATTPDGHLWVICTEGSSRVVRRYDVSGSGILTMTSAVITGLSAPLAVAVSPAINPDDSLVLVADGGASQQVKAYDNVRSGTPTIPAAWSSPLGLEGGYNAVNGPNVTNTKFCFMDTKNVPRTFVSFQADGSFWLGDMGNERYLHFDSAKNYLGQMAYLSANYVASICAGDPTRVFSKGWLEFAVNYSQPIATSWTLVKNWRAGLDPKYTPGTGTSDGFKGVVKFSNNRTYGAASNDGSSGRSLFELQTNGIARDTQEDSVFAIAGTTTKKVLHEDCTLRWRVTTANSVTFYKNEVTGFDASNNPQWGPDTIVATAPFTSVDPVSGGFTGTFGARQPVTTGNVMISANSSGASWTYHLGGVRAGGTDWLWKAAPTGIYYDGHGTIGDSTYPANSHFVVGRSIILNCHGEGYQGGQADQYLHYWENGLLVGQFGKDLSAGPPPANTIVPGRCGNAFSSSPVQYGSDLYLWANDEWGTGLHRWKINNTSSITEMAPINITLPSSGGSGEGLTGEYFTGANFETLTDVSTDSTVNFTWTGLPLAGLPADNFSVRWSGLVEPLNSETYTFYTQSDAGVRLWVNGQKIIDNWTAHASTENASTPITLTAGQQYRIVMEYYDTTGTAVAQLKWSSASQTKQVIPTQQLYPSNAAAIHCGGTAIGRFLEDPMGTTGTGIQTTANSIDLSGATDPAPMAVYQTQRRFSCSYAFQDLKPYTNYKVRVHVAELTVTSPGARVIPITVNYVADISPGIDPIALAGVRFKAAVYEFTVTSDNAGLIHLRFWSANNTLIAALEIERAASSARFNPCFAAIGLGSGLEGTYYNGTSFNTQVATRSDQEINFTWGTGNPIAGVGPSNYTVRWNGRILSYKPGTYSFTLSATAGGRLWVDNQLVVDSWTVSGNHTGTIDLNSASAFYDIKLEYINTTGSSNVALKWKRAGDAIFDTVPRRQLYPPEQTIPVVYAFTGGSLAPSSVDSHFAASNVGRGSALTTPATFSTNWAYATGDKTASSETAALTASYFAITLTPNAGTTCSLSSLTFDAAFYESGGAANTSYTTNYFVRSSLDNYATTIGAVIPEPGQTATNPTFHAKTVTLGGTTFTGLTGPVTFRIYVYDSITGATRLSAIDNLTINGSVSP